MNDRDDELDAWQRQWQDDAAVPPRIGTRAIAEDRRYRWFVIGEYALSALMLAATLAYLLWSGTDVARLLFFGIWGIGVPTLAFTVWNRRGLWRAADASGRAFLALAQQRCRRGLRAVHASYGVLAAVVAYNVATFTGAFGPAPAAGGEGIAWTLAVAAVYLIVLIAAQRRLRRRLCAYAALERETDL